MRIFIKISILLSLIFLSTSSVESQSTSKTYYVNSVSGNDTNNGTSEASAWKSTTKVNTATFVPGDVVLFRRGDTFAGGLVIKASGQPGKNITFGAYGSGARPIFNTLRPVTLTWTSAGTNVWKSTKGENVVLLNNKRAVLEKNSTD